MRLRHRVFQLLRALGLVVVGFLTAFFDCIFLLGGLHALWIDYVLDPFLRFIEALGRTLFGFVDGRGRAFFSLVVSLYGRRLSFIRSGSRALFL